MKGLNVLVAFLGGAAVGAAVGILFAPEKGEDTRHKIAEILRKKGIRLNRSEMENLVDEIAAEIKGEGAEKNKTYKKNRATMMFADDRSIENLQQLFVEFKKYLKLQKEYTKLEITEKLSILLSALVLLSVVIILGMVALFYLSFALAYILDPLVGGLMVSFSIIAGFHLLLVLLVITFRKKLIINPMVNFIAGLFFENDNEK